MLDLAIAEAINHFGRGTFIDSLSALISSWFFIVPIFIVVGIIIFVKDKKRAKLILLAIFIALLLHVVVTEGFLKTLVPTLIGSRDRPYIAYPDLITPIGSQSLDSSFPSGHVAAIAAFCVAIALFYRKNKKVWIVSAIAIALMMFSRVHNGMHYPSEVVAGVVFGVVYGFVGVWAAKKILK